MTTRIMQAIRKPPKLSLLLLWQAVAVREGFRYINDFIWPARGLEPELSLARFSSAISLVELGHASTPPSSVLFCLRSLLYILQSLQDYIHGVLLYTFIQSRLDKQHCCCCYRLDVCPHAPGRIYLCSLKIVAFRSGFVKEWSPW